MEIRDVNAIFKSAYIKNTSCKDSTNYSYLESLRNVAVIELLFATGARVSEIANLKKEDIDFYSGTVSIKGKGDKERNIQICNKETIKILKEYYKLFKNQDKKCRRLFSG